MSLFACPVCENALKKNEKSYLCPGGHCFDISSAGYVHLLPANRMHSQNPGDDADMVRARHAFLSAGYYENLKTALGGLCAKLAGDSASILDSGCGEGYYTDAAAKTLPNAKIAGIDISKTAVRFAAKRVKSSEFAVASAFHLPIANNSIDLIINCFSPLCLSEFSRVLKPDGYFLYVVPGPTHLWELKKVLYETPYPNEEEAANYPGFMRTQTISLENTILLKSSADILNLFRMTPYFFKTPKSGIDRLSALETLNVKTEFAIHVYKLSD